MGVGEADTVGILRRPDKWPESFLDAGTSQVSLEKFPFNETRPFLAEWLSKNIKWHCSCPPDDCQKTKSTISQNSLIWAQPSPACGPGPLVAAKIKEGGRKEISLIFRSMFWPRCQLRVIGFPENSRTLGGNVTRGSKYIIISPRPPPKYISHHNSLTPGGDRRHILKGVWKSVRWQFISSIKYRCILPMGSNEFLCEWISDLRIQNKNSPGSSYKGRFRRFSN